MLPFIYLRLFGTIFTSYSQLSQSNGIDTRNNNNVSNGQTFPIFYTLLILVFGTYSQKKFNENMGTNIRRNKGHYS